MNAIKQNLEVATSEFDTYLTLSPDVVIDMNGNPFINVSAVQVTNYTDDTTSPELHSFSLA